MMENLKVKVKNEAESKEVQGLGEQLGYVRPEVHNYIQMKDGGYVCLGYEFEGKHEDLILFVGGFRGEDVDSISCYKELTIPQLRDLVVLKRNDVNDATHENSMYRYVKLNNGWYYFDGDANRWLESTGGKPAYYEKLKPIEKKMKETEYLMQGENGERLMESVGELKGSQWDLQVGGDHYKSMKIQPAKFALENKLDYCQANAIKYICRHESKNGKQDLEKAKHYIDLLIEHYYGDQNAI